MVVLNCPLCGSPVRVPTEEIHTRYYCKKCHTPFHLDKSRRGVVGEPPDIELQVQDLKQEALERLATIPIRAIAGGLAALVVIWLAWYSFFGPADRLEDAAEKAAHALAAKDRDYLESIAEPGTAADIDRWFDEVEARLAQTRGSWHGGKEEVVEVHVGQEDPSGRTGAVAITIHPGMATNLDVSLANPSAATASQDAPFDVETAWRLSRWGHWRLDGRETYALPH